MLLRETQNIVGCNAIDNFGRGQRSRTTISQVSASTPVLIRRLVTAITGYFWEGSIKLSSWATPNNAESEFSEIEFNVFENTFLRIQEEPPAKERRLVFVQQSSKSYGYFSKRQETSLIFCAKTLPVRSSQAAEPEARHSHRNSKRCTPSHHVPERISPYMPCRR